MEQVWYAQSVRHLSEKITGSSREGQAPVLRDRINTSFCSKRSKPRLHAYASVKDLSANNRSWRWCYVFMKKFCMTFGGHCASGSLSFNQGVSK